MTNREFYEFVIAGENTEEMRKHANKQIEKMNARNAKRSSQPSKRSQENEPIKAQIVETIGDGGTAKTIGERVGITTQKASALCGQLVKNGIFTATDEKVDKRKVKVYRLA